MTFKDQLAADIEAVFMNCDEFAAVHEIDGLSVVCVVMDTDDVPNPNAIGTHTRTMSVHIKASLLPGRPVPDSSLVVDGKRWTVASVVEELGMLMLKLEAART